MHILGPYMPNHSVDIGKRVKYYWFFDASDYEINNEHP